jgi:hypothetical protein
LYAMFIYMMASSSFKMIDAVPNNITRWMGAGVTTFNDERGDIAQGLTQYAAFGGASIANQMVGSLTTASKGLGQMAAAPFAGSPQETQTNVTGTQNPPNNNGGGSGGVQRGGGSGNGN